MYQAEALTSYFGRRTIEHLMILRINYYKSLFVNLPGVCMNIVSGCVQICKFLFVYLTVPCMNIVSGCVQICKSLFVYLTGPCMNIVSGRVQICKSLFVYLTGPCMNIVLGCIQICKSLFVYLTCPCMNIVSGCVQICKSLFVYLTGPCMNIVSGCVQICKSLRDYTYDTGNSHYINKTKSCQSSIIKSTNHLKHELHTHFSMDFHIRGISPGKGDNLFKDTDNSDSSHDNHRDLSPFGRCSPLPPAENSGKDDSHDLSPRSNDVSFSTGISR